MTIPALPAGVGVTALITAYARAQESRTKEPLFNDPVASYFIAEATKTRQDGQGRLPRLGPARENGTSPLWSAIHAYFAHRTPFYDRYVTRVVRGGHRQVVILGAGLDARALRIDLPHGTVVFEVDSAPVLNFKEAVLARHGLDDTSRRISVRTDLRDDWTAALLAAGFNPSQPTAWLAEGLIMYFTPDEADRLLSALSQVSAPKSTLAAEYLNRRFQFTDASVANPDDEAMAQLFAATNQGGPVDEPRSWLARHNWLTQQRDFAEEVNELGRSLPSFFDPHRPDPLKLWLFTATISPA